MRLVATPDSGAELFDNPMCQVVHILRGLNTPASKAMKPDDRVFTTLDSLSCGPLEPLSDLAEWEKRRLSFWRTISPYDPDEEGHEFLGDIPELLSARKLVVWLGTSLDDQMALAWLPGLLRAVGATPEQIDVVQFHRNHRGIEILSLGMLNPDQFAAHPPPVTLSPSDLGELEHTWNAIVSMDPQALVASLRSAYEPLPFLKRALRSLLQRYPEKGSGVNATEFQILHWVRRAAPSAARIIGQVLGGFFDAARAGTGGLDLCGDFWLFWRMLRLGDPSLREPALEIGGSRTEYRNTTVRLTAFGERVLDGQANFIDANGIDDWVAGVHLQSDAGRVWFHDQGNLIRG
jgi:hypothetical protein